MKGSWNYGRRRGKNILWGLLFVGLGGFILANSMGWFGDIGLWTILFTILLGAWFFESLVHVEFGGMLFSLAFLAILYDEQLGIEKLTPWPVLWAALCGSIGLHMIFKNFYFGRRKREDEQVINHHGTVLEVKGEGQDSEYFYVKQNFGSAVRYVNSKVLKKAELVNSFGNLSVYLDRAMLMGHTAEIYVSNSFGKVQIYLPDNWSVVTKISKSFGESDAKEHFIPEAEDQVVITGTSSFGEVEIYYI